MGPIMQQICFFLYIKKHSHPNLQVRGKRRKGCHSTKGVDHCGLCRFLVRCWRDLYIGKGFGKSVVLIVSCFFWGLKIHGLQREWFFKVSFFWGSEIWSLAEGENTGATLIPPQWILPSALARPQPGEKIGMPSTKCCDMCWEELHTSWHWN
jgi:hypothetical protein